MQQSDFPVAESSSLLGRWVCVPASPMPASLYPCLHPGTSALQLWPRACRIVETNSRLCKLSKICKKEREILVRKIDLHIVVRVRDIRPPVKNKDNSIEKYLEVSTRPATHIHVLYLTLTPHALKHP